MLFYVMLAVALRYSRGVATCYILTIMLYRRCPHCGNRIPEGTKCQCEIDAAERRKKLHNKMYDTYHRDKDSAAFYKSREWTKARERALARCHDIDVYAYMTAGMITPADVVHHIIPVRDSKTDRLNPANLLPVSQASHMAIHKRYEEEDKAAVEQELQRMLADYLQQT